MRVLNTALCPELRLNRVAAHGMIGPRDKAEHSYTIDREVGEGSVKHFASIAFQFGPRHAEGSVDGVIDVDLLEIIADRLRGFQSGEFATDDNAEALYHVEAAIEAFNRRTIERHKRGVLGKQEQ